MRRLPLALIVSTVGAAVFYVVASLLAVPTDGRFEIVGSAWEFVGAVVGSCTATLLVARPRAFSLRRNLAPATGITMITYAAIAVGHAVDQVLVRGEAVDSESLGLFFSAVACLQENGTCEASASAAAPRTGQCGVRYEPCACSAP